MQEKYGPVGLLHLDAHPDTSETTFGEKISNATPFRRAVEEGLLDCQRVVQIGLRGTGNSPVDYEFGRSHVSYFILEFLLLYFALCPMHWREFDRAEAPCLPLPLMMLGILARSPRPKHDANFKLTFGVDPSSFYWSKESIYFGKQLVFFAFDRPPTSFRNTKAETEMLL